MAEEYHKLSLAITAKDNEGIISASQEIDAGLRVAAANAPKTQGELQLELLEETRALRRAVADLAAQQAVGYPLFFCLFLLS